MGAYVPFLPRRGAELKVWSAHFLAKISADPGSYGLTPGMADAYAAAHATYAAAFDAATNPPTRTSPAIAAKESARAALLDEARRLARIVRAAPGVTSPQRIDLGLSVPNGRGGGGGAPIPAPAEAPQVSIVSAVGRTLRVRLRDAASPTRRGRPAGVAGAAVFTYTADREGGDPPARLSDWTLRGFTTRDALKVTLEPTTPSGATIWVAAYWLSPRLQIGPASRPVCANIPGGSVEARGGIEAAATRRAA